MSESRSRDEHPAPGDDSPPRAGKPPTPQGFQAAGPGNAHGVPPGDAPGHDGEATRPFHPEGGKPAADPEAMAKRLLDAANPGPPAEGDAGPLGAGEHRAAPAKGQP